MTETDNSTLVRCANPDCRIAEGGRCVEGLELDECPYYGRTAEESPAEGAESSAEQEEYIPLLPANLLRGPDAAKFLRAGDARVVAIIGPSDTGKTSLIAGLYDLFQLAPVKTVNFAGSETLHAFEQACHDARAASRRNTPHMQRTPRGDVRFYHLDLVFADRRLSLLLGDRAGEEYREAADDVSVAEGFPEIRRADCLTVLVDGERLLDNGGRHNLKSDIAMMLLAMRDAEVFPKGSNLAVVLTKFDLIAASDKRVRVEKDFQSIVSDIRAAFDELAGQTADFLVAAAPKDGSIQRGDGIDDLLMFWLEPPNWPVTIATPTLSSLRAFARLRPIEEPVE
ncbi:hypothetical protein ACIQUG_32210 [Ensifer sp. NPDC090286]|uniref:TRAFAC clade GTPase domain-containing protein n=1 Tax=Ensifer sp. NPDC090286 TaxID=3363991 RepID=UPI00383B089E